MVKQSVLQLVSRSELSLWKKTDETVAEHPLCSSFDQDASEWQVPWITPSPTAAVYELDPKLSLWLMNKSANNSDGFWEKIISGTVLWSVLPPPHHLWVASSLHPFWNHQDVCCCEDCFSCSIITFKVVAGALTVSGVYINAAIGKFFNLQCSMGPFFVIARMAIQRMRCSGNSVCFLCWLKLPRWHWGSLGL